jgi:hypothetical protein
MKRVGLYVCAGIAILILGGFAGIAGSRAQTASDEPQFTNGNRLVRPANYRDWIYLSSGLGMTYSKQAGAPELFTNVFVSPAAYRAFQATGKWPDKTIFVLEERAASSRGSIVQGGHFQGDLVELAASVKDEKHFEEKWAYFSFSGGDSSAAPNPRARCWQCHNDHGAVENTFVQFYPTLKDIAQKLGTYNQEKAANESGPK